VGSSVIIVGAGPVGLSLALCLGHSGVDSIILEKNSGLQQYSRAILIPPRTLDIFDGWGLLKPARQAGIFSTPFRCMTQSLTGMRSPLIFPI
jgi:2-polyprenyl-6-methoxyphenol hydroxylase-like FAD-dependent oxidoreductase